MDIQTNRSNEPDSEPGLGHNSAGLSITIEVRLYNRVFKRFGNGKFTRTLDVEAGSTASDVLALLGIPESEVFIAFVNGRDITTLQGQIKVDRELDEGDILALSGPIPYSWGYGAPMV